VQKRAEGEASTHSHDGRREPKRIRRWAHAEAGVILSKGEAQATAYREQVAELTAQGVTAARG